MQDCKKRQDLIENIRTIRFMIKFHKNEHSSTRLRFLTEMSYPEHFGYDELCWKLYTGLSSTQSSSSYFIPDYITFISKEQDNQLIIDTCRSIVKHVSSSRRVERTNIPHDVRCANDTSNPELLLEYFIRAFMEKVKEPPQNKKEQSLMKCLMNINNSVKISIFATAIINIASILIIKTI